MRSFAFNSDVDTRWGIERWENEGGLIRLGTAVPSHSNRPSDADHWMRDLPHNFREAGLSVWSVALPNFLLILTLDLQPAIKRLSGRRICTKCGGLYPVYSKPAKQAGKCDQCGGVLTQREDDRAEVIQQRFKSYERETMPVIESFRNEFEHLIWEESSTAPLDQVTDRVGQRLEQLIRR